VRIERNMIRSNMMGKGIYVWTGEILPFEGTYARANRIAALTIDANRITTGSGAPLRGETFRRSAGGIVLLAGWHYGRDGVVRNVRIRNNRIATAYAAVRLIGGIGPPSPSRRISPKEKARGRCLDRRRGITPRSAAAELSPARCAS
jgi:hypothetical protein